MKKVSLVNTKRGYQYVKKYGMAKLYLKARERLERNRMERGYQQWMLDKRPADSEKELQREHLFSWNPLISIVVPVYCTPEAFLREMIESVLSQTYSNLELCLADGSVGDDGAERVIRGYLKQDSRIRYERLPENKGIAGNTNAAAAMASGEYIAFLDHDDILEEHALFEVVRWLQDHPDADMVYTDEDKVSPDSGTYFQPHFKPDFNFELLRTNNYICHFLIVRKQLAEAAGLYLEEYDGAQDYDFILRCCEKTEKIGHISKILYHWRCHPSSTAVNPESKLYAYEAGKRALESHLSRMGLQGEVEALSDPGFYRINYALDAVPKVSIIVMDVPAVAGLKQFMKALSKSRTYTNYEILLLLDNPEKNKIILNFIKEHRQTAIKVVYCTSACNKFVTFSRLAEKLDSEFLLFLEGRIDRISRGFLETFLGDAQRPGTGAVGGRVYDSSYRLKCGARILGLGGLVGDAFEGLKFGYTGYFHKAVLQQNCHAVSSKAMMVKKECFLEAGGFSQDVEDRLKDVDLCLKLETLGFHNIYEPGVFLVEQNYRTRKKKGSRPAAVFEKKWKDLLLEPDRFYNCNLSLESPDYRIRETE